MGRPWTLISICILTAGLFGQAPTPAPEGAPAAPAASPATPPPASDEANSQAKPLDKRATKDVEIKRECKVLEDVFARRTVLHYLKNEKEPREAILKLIDPESATSIKAVVDREENFNELDYHFVEKIRNCEQRILGKLRKDRFQGLADLLEAIAQKTHPNSAVFANLMSTVELNVRWAQRREKLDLDDVMKEAIRKLTSETARIQGTAGFSVAELAKARWKDTKPDDFPAQWLDRSSEIISFEFGEIPEAKEFPLVDLAKATREELLSLPEVEEEIADELLRYRKKRGIFGPEELRFLEKLPTHLAEPLQTLCMVSRTPGQAPKKSWTIIVYLNAANNLEPFGIEDMNEMELAGSDANINIVVECARFQGKQAVRPNGQYLSNPYSEFAGSFYWGLDNSPGTRRYYMLKDEDKVRVRSVMLENVGATDAGRPEPLANFGKWAIENFPAEHYALVIWNHGAGWTGVSYDDNTHHGMDMPDVRKALEDICAKLKDQGKQKVDVLDFDACLMATLEVGYELKDTVEYLAASQETEPGQGMHYGDYLKWLATYPEAPPASLAKAMVETYVRSYAPEGSQAPKERWSGSETKSAMRLSKIAELKTAVEDAARLLHAKPEILGDIAEEIVKDTRKFGRLVDIHDFFEHASKKLKGDQPFKDAAQKIFDLIGYPEDGKDTLVNEVVISRRTAGDVIWGFNGWAMPPRGLAPFVSNARFAKTPLVGPDEKGNYVARIKFPPTLRNPKTDKWEFVKEINYRFEDGGEKKTIKDFKNTVFTAGFPTSAVVIAEGHNVGNNRSRGISLYFPAYLGFDKDYRRLKFAEGSAWAELCEKFPIKKIEKRAAVAVLGVNHVQKAVREKLGGIVVVEDLEQSVRKHDFAAIWSSDLKTLQRNADCIKDPRPYGEDWAQTLAHYRDGIVILDNTMGGETSGGGGFDFAAMLGMGGRRVSLPRVVGPEGRVLMRHLQQGGRVLLGSAGVTRAVWDTPLYRDTLGVEYVRTWNRGYEFELVGTDGQKAKAKFTIEVARKGEALTVLEPTKSAPGVTPFAVLPDGQWIGARIQKPLDGGDRELRAVVLGFHLIDIKDDAARRQILKDAMEFLEGGRADLADSKSPKVESAPATPVTEERPVLESGSKSP